MGLLTPYAHSQNWEPESSDDEALISYLKDFHDSVIEQTDFSSGEFKFKTDQGTKERFPGTAPSEDLLPEDERLNHAGVYFTRDEEAFFTRTPEMFLEYDAYSGDSNGTFYIMMDGDNWEDVINDLSTEIGRIDEPESYIERAAKLLS